MGNEPGPGGIVAVMRADVSVTGLLSCKGDEPTPTPKYQSPAPGVLLGKISWLAAMMMEIVSAPPPIGVSVSVTLIGMLPKSNWSGSPLTVISSDWVSGAAVFSSVRRKLLPGTRIEAWACEAPALAANAND